MAMGSHKYEVLGCWGAGGVQEGASTAHVWRPEHNFPELVPLFTVGTRDPTQVFRLMQQALYLLGHLNSPSVIFIQSTVHSICVNC